MDVSSIAMQGLQQAQTPLETTARRLASTGASPDGAPADTADLSDAAVSLITARNQFAANIQVMKVADAMRKSTVDLLG